MRKLLAAVAAVGMVAVGCTDGGSDPGITGGPTTTGDVRTTVYPGEPRFLTALRQVGGCDALLDHLRTEALERVGPYGLSSGGFRILAVPEAGRAVAADDATSAPAPNTTESAGDVGGGSGTGDHSTTNVQEEGVDEPDIVKTDGRRIVTLSNGVLSVVDVTSSPPQRVGSVELATDNSHPTDFLLAGDKVLVFGSGWIHDDGGDRSGPTIDVWRPGRQLATITEVSIADPANPAVGATLRTDGWYLTSRLVGDVARVVVRSEPTELPFVYPQSQSGEARAEAANREVVQQSRIEDWMPSYELVSPDGSVTASGLLVSCERVSAPTEFAGFGTLSVLTFDLSSTMGDGDATSVLAGGDTAYASDERLYVATNRYVDPLVIEQGDRDAIERLEQDYSTSIHAFDISGSRPAEYLASGTVPGHLINQFAMSEHEGRLRAATTRGMPWSATDESESLVTLLEHRGDELVTVGQVGDMGRGERIYSVRYAGDIAYVVTFRQTDPFYTVDLSDPTAPRVVGELKIPGFSSYLHPIDDDLVIGVGQQADDRGVPQGSKVSLFDVTDLASPTEVATWTLPASQSRVEHDHHAFLYWPATKQLVMPLYQFEAGSDGFVGAIVLHVDRSGISELGRIAHASIELSGEQYGCDVPYPMPRPVERDGGIGTSGAASDCPAITQVDPVQRALVIGDDLWTLGQWTLQQNALVDLTTGASIRID